MWKRKLKLDHFANCVLLMSWFKKEYLMKYLIHTDQDMSPRAMVTLKTIINWWYCKYTLYFKNIVLKFIIPTDIYAALSNTSCKIYVVLYKAWYSSREVWSLKTLINIFSMTSLYLAVQFNLKLKKGKNFSILKFKVNTHLTF